MTESRYAETVENRRGYPWFLALISSYFLIIIGVQLLSNFWPDVVAQTSTLVFDYRIDWFWRNRAYDLGYLNHLEHPILTIETYYLQIVAMFYASVCFVLWRVMIPIKGGRFLVKHALERIAAQGYEKFSGPITTLLGCAVGVLATYTMLFIWTAGDTIDGRDFIFGIPPRAHAYIWISVEVFYLMLLTFSSEFTLNIARYLIVEKLWLGKGR